MLQQNQVGHQAQPADAAPSAKLLREEEAAAAEVAAAQAASPPFCPPPSASMYINSSLQPPVPPPPLLPPTHSECVHTFISPGHLPLGSVQQDSCLRHASAFVCLLQFHYLESVHSSNRPVMCHLPSSPLCIVHVNHSVHLVFCENGNAYMSSAEHIMLASCCFLLLNHCSCEPGDQD